MKNLIILGLPKCATTTLADLIVNNSGYSYFGTKEPNILGDDKGKHQFENNNAKLDATINYYRKPDVLTYLDNKDCHFILVVRPVKAFINSMYNHYVRRYSDSRKPNEIYSLARDQIYGPFFDFSHLTNFVINNNVLVLTMQEIFDEESVLEKLGSKLKIKINNNKITKIKSNRSGLSRFELLNKIIHKPSKIKSIIRPIYRILPSATRSNITGKITDLNTVAKNQAHDWSHLDEEINKLDNDLYRLLESSY